MILVETVINTLHGEKTSFTCGLEVGTARYRTSLINKKLFPINATSGPYLRLPHTPFAIFLGINVLLESNVWSYKEPARSSGRVPTSS